MARRMTSRHALSLIICSAFFGPLLPAQTPPAVEKMVDVGSYRLFFKIIPGRGPAILLESGGGLDSTQWDDLAPRLAEATGATVIAYDRAGFGRSDLPTSKYDLHEDTAALMRGLGKLGLDKSLVLVGHSYGGFLLRFMASEYPAAIRGLIFIDPFTVEFVDALGIEACNELMGQLPFDASQPDKLTKAQRAEARMMGAPGNNLAEKMVVMRTTRVPMGPVARVITSGTDWLPTAEIKKAWREAHERFAASIEGAKLVIAGMSDHMIPLRDPELVVATVVEVFQKIDRAPRPLLTSARRRPSG